MASLFDAERRVSASGIINSVNHVLPGPRKILMPKHVISAENEGFGGIVQHDQDARLIRRDKASKGLESEYRSLLELRTEWINGECRE